MDLLENLTRIKMEEFLSPNLCEKSLQNRHQNTDFLEKRFKIFDLLKYLVIDLKYYYII